MDRQGLGNHGKNIVEMLMQLFLFGLIMQFYNLYSDAADLGNIEISRT